MIKFIYFDVGGVMIIDLSLMADWEGYKKQIGLDPKYSNTFDAFWDAMDPKLHTIMSVDELIPDLRSKFELNFPDNFSLQDDFVKRLRKNETIWPVVEIVRKKYKTGLLTNMYPGMLKAIQVAKLMPSTSWDVVVDSSIVRCQKPDKEIYEVAQKMAGVSANEILFIDNSLRNVNAAKEVGWQAFHYKPDNLEESNELLLEYINNQ